MASEEANVVPHEELCEAAFVYYRELSSKAGISNSLVPAAIEYYKRWVPTGERKMVSTPGTLIDALEAGWVFDPWLSPRGGPIIVGVLSNLSTAEPRDNSVWFLVKGTPEQVDALKPFVELPSEEEEAETEFKPYGLRTMFIAHDEKNSSGDPKGPPDGFVVMHKDHIFAKGTVYTKIPEVTIPGASP